MDAWRTDWANNKENIAYKLNSGECGGSYGDAVLILCAVLSALAAEVWPGDGKDRKRFVELLKEFAPQNFETTKISIPLLIKSLSSAGRADDVTVIQREFPKSQQGNVLTGEDDKTEGDILRVCPALSSKDLRKCSYANLLYKEVRSPYVHEYRPGKRADSRPMTQRPDVPVSYVGWIDPDPNNRDRDPEQRIYFTVEWISRVATSIARAVDRAGSLPLPAPSQWWVDGCSV